MMTSKKKTQKGQCRGQQVFYFIQFACDFFFLMHGVYLFVKLSTRRFSQVNTGMFSAIIILSGETSGGFSSRTLSLVAILSYYIA